MPKIFLSPSTQEWNPYVTSGTEEYWMNQLADRMEPYLRASGIDFVRNDPSRNVRGAIDDSNAGNYDFHLALHSNAAGGEFAGRIRGVDFYYYPTSQDAEKMAIIMTDNMKSIYPIPEKVRPISSTTLGEIRETKAPAVLAELGYHDNVEDETWLVNNLNSIAANLVLSLTEYFGIPFIQPGPVRIGKVTTNPGSSLNIRNYPNTTATIIGSIPSGSEVYVYGRFNNWYVVKYNGITGYSSVDFISL